MKANTIIIHESSNKLKHLYNSKNIVQIIFCLVIFIISSVLIYSHFNNNQLDKYSAKNAPVDPVVNKLIQQARTLQNLGQLTDSAMTFEKYALQGFPDAMFYIATAYIKGWGVTPDLDKARNYLLNAVEFNFRNRGKSAYRLGRLFRRALGPDCNTIAVEWYKKSLSWNYTKSAIDLAYHYERGLGVEQSFNRASEYYEIATKAGYEAAMIKYARLLISDQQGIQNNFEYSMKLTQYAIKQLQIKSHQGKSSSAKLLGRVYRNGVLVIQNNNTAIEWFKLSSELGDIGAMHDLAHLLIFQNEKDNRNKVIYWFQKSANLGHGGSATALGRLHLKQQYGLEQAKAIYWFKKGVELGHGGSMHELAKLNYAGQLIKYDLNETYRLLKLGKKQGHSGSSKMLKKLKLKNKLKSDEKLEKITNAPPLKVNI